MFSKSFLALALIHISVAAISVVFFGANPFWLVSGLIFATATINTLHATNSVYVVTILCLLSAGTFVLTLMLGTCYYMQGEGFNDAFFYHFNSGSLVIAARSYSSVFYPSLFGILFAFLAPAVIYKTQPRRVWATLPVSVFWLLALLGNYPFYSLASYQMGHDVEPGIPVPQTETTVSYQSAPPTPAVKTPVDQVDEPEVVTEVQKINPEKNQPESNVEPTGVSATESQAEPESELTSVPEPPRRKNIILIYAESLEALYFDQELFGDLTPNIRKLSEHAHQFTNLVQVAGTGWTIAGIVASQCGFPLKVSNHLASNSTMASVDKPYPDESCLADILSDIGYATVYMGGAPLWFAGKDNFLNTHGYQSISGEKELATLIPDKKYHSGWGIYDDDLFDLALTKLQLLEKKSQPYLLTLLTLDTHHPRGIPSRSCKRLADNKDSMSNAIYCSDQLISKFIHSAMNIADMKDTIIVLFSDHLSLRNTLWSTLRDNQDRRRLTFMIFDDTRATVSNVHASHFDVAPTILDAAGLSDHASVGAGVSLITHSNGQPGDRQTGPAGAHTPSLIHSNASVREHGLSLSRRDLSLTIGDLTLRANDSGQKFVAGMYLAVLNEQGQVVDAIYSDDYSSLAKNLEGRFVVGISVMRAPPYSATYFYGRLSPDGKGIAQHEFNYDIYLNANEIWPSAD